MSFISGRPGFDEEVTIGSSSSLQHMKGGLLPLYAEGSEDQMLVTAPAIEREHMFDKVVTPSDVGKLNRLVIPKQHAEKYFPLDSSTTNDRAGLLLNFEDRNGKPWRFRYSYWNSSQSYVMTKGWSRFVKDKKLDAGDIVSFHRGVGESAKDRLFIDWRRRPDAIPSPLLSSIPRQFPYWNPLFRANAIVSGTPHHHMYPTIYGSNYPYSVGGNGGGEEVGQVHARGGGSTNSGVDEQMVFDSVPVVQGKVAAKRLRLFGVTMDCPISESDDHCEHQSTHHSPHPHFHDSSALNSIPALQLIRPYNRNDVAKGEGSMSLDLDI